MRELEVAVDSLGCGRGVGSTGLVTWVSSSLMIWLISCLAEVISWLFWFSCLVSKTVRVVWSSVVSSSALGVIFWVLVVAMMVCLAW